MNLLIKKEYNFPTSVRHLERDENVLRACKNMNCKNLGIKSPRGNKTVQNLMFNGVVFLSDSHVPTNHVFMLNEKHLYLWYHPKRNFYATPFQAPINQEVKVSRIIWMGSFGSSNNRYHAAFTALAA